MRHHVYLSPGMFGFARLAAYDYFVHVVRAVERRMHEAGHEVVVHVVDVAPTASIRRRAARLAEVVAQTAGDDPDEPIHLLGHSTGGLDARLVASPAVHLPIAPGTLAWIGRLASVSTLSTPHYGTPLAAFFATVSGQRMLYAVSALTVVALSLGTPPLAAASALVMGLARLDRALGVELSLLDRTTEAVLRVLEPSRGLEVKSYLDAIRGDQGAVLQLTPEAMDLFQAGVEDRPGVHYQSAASMAPPPGPVGIVKSLGSPWRAVSATLFATMHTLTARFDERYPCAAAHAGEAEALLAKTFGRAPGARANDGVVPLRSQIWGDLVWVGYADHLDVLGHFAADGSELHVDWMTSGSRFDRTAFRSLMDALVGGMMRATEPPPTGPERRRAERRGT